MGNDQQADDEGKDDGAEFFSAAQKAVDQMRIRELRDHQKGSHKEDERQKIGEDTPEPIEDLRGDVKRDDVAGGIEGGEENDGGGDDGGGAGGGHSTKIHVGGDFMFVNDVETGETESGAGDIESGDDPEESAPDVVGKGAGEVRERGASADRGWFAEKFSDEADGEEGGGDAEGDHVGQRVEFRAEIRRGAGNAGDETVEHIEDHGGEDEVTRESECTVRIRRVFGDYSAVRVKITVTGGIVDGGESAQAVPEREHRRQERDAAPPLAEAGKLFPPLFKGAEFPLSSLSPITCHNRLIQNAQQPSTPPSYPPTARSVTPRSESKRRDFSFLT